MCKLQWNLNSAGLFPFGRSAPAINCFHRPPSGFSGLPGFRRRGNQNPDRPDPGPNRGSKPGFGTGVEIRPGTGFGSGSAETQEKVKKNRSGSKTPFVPPFGHSRKKSPREKPGLEPGTKTQKKGSSGQKPG